MSEENHAIFTNQWFQLFIQTLEKMFTQLCYNHLGMRKIPAILLLYSQITHLIKNYMKFIYPLEAIISWKFK